MREGMTIGAPTDAQAPLCRQWLPGAFPRAGAAPELLVASDAHGVHGVLALDWVPGGFVLHMHVAPARRQQGAADALPAQALALAGGETAALRVTMPVAQGSPADRFLQASGFTVTRRLIAFDTDGGNYGPTLSALLHRGRKRLPEGVTIVPLAQAPLPTVAALVAGQFGLLYDDMLAKLDPAHADPYDHQLSQVLLRDGVAVGAILGRRYSEVIEVDINVVTPALRRGLANLMLLEAIVRLSGQAGLKRSRFSCEVQVRDTVNVGARLLAARLPDQLQYGLLL
jgi:GNAT superfamily N-acetyltransferase